MSIVRVWGLETTFVWEVIDVLEQLGMHYSCVGEGIESETDLPNRMPEFAMENPFVLGPMSPDERTNAAAGAWRAGLTTPLSAVSPTAIVSARSSVNHGAFVGSQVAVGSLSKLGCFSVLNRSASVGHHASIEGFVAIGPGAVICSGVSIGFGSFIGAGAVVLPGIKIGRNSLVGAGALVTGDVGDGEVVAGSPARILKPNAARLALEACPWCS